MDEQRKNEGWNVADYYYYATLNMKVATFHFVLCFVLVLMDLYAVNACLRLAPHTRDTKRPLLCAHELLHKCCLFAFWCAFFHWKRFRVRCTLSIPFPPEKSKKIKKRNSFARRVSWRNGECCASIFGTEN